MRDGLLTTGRQRWWYPTTEEGNSTTLPRHSKHCQRLWLLSGARRRCLWMAASVEEATLSKPCAWAPERCWLDGLTPMDLLRRASPAGFGRLESTVLTQQAHSS